jgi:TRAP-type C4-dicarboxylate transport system permease small subunit
MNLIRSVFDRIFAGLTWFACAILVAQTLITTANVFCRYVLNFSVYWADEVSLVLLIWFTFIALAIGIKLKVHVAIEFILSWMPTKFLEIVVERFVALCIFAIGAVFMFFGVKLTMEGMFSTLPATDFPSAVDYIFIPVCGFLVMYAAIEIFAGVKDPARYLTGIFLNRGEKK